MMGNRLKDILKREKVKPIRISKDLGMDKGYLSRVLNEKQDISLKKLEMIADYLGYDIELVKRKHSRKGGE
jgi:transcriptional regulator with XRE-family HTH domain